MSSLFDPAALEAALDRLVVDDLPPNDRRALLLHLETNPDGWRRCALAFLEDQAWRAALASPPVAAASVSVRPLALARPDRRSSGSRFGRFAVAATPARPGRLG